MTDGCGSKSLLIPGPGRVRLAQRVREFHEQWAARPRLLLLAPWPGQDEEDLDDAFPRIVGRHAGPQRG